MEDLSVDYILKNGECISAVHKRLQHMLKLSKIILYEQQECAPYNQKLNSHRSIAIKWIKDVSLIAHSSIETRDTSVQLFDRFLQLCIRERKFQLNHKNIQMTAAVAVVLASKLHDSKQLTMKNFPHLKTEDFVHAERIILEQLNYHLLPSVNPATFIQNFALLWAGGSGNESLINLANEFVGDMLEDVRSTKYSPSKIAIVALLCACSRLEMDCDWLKNIPKSLFEVENNHNPVIEPTIEGFNGLELKNCQELLHSIHSMRETTAIVTTTSVSIGDRQIPLTPITNHHSLHTITTTRSSSSSSIPDVSPNGLIFLSRAKTCKRILFETISEGSTVESSYANDTVDKDVTDCQRSDLSLKRIKID